MPATPSGIKREWYVCMYVCTLTRIHGRISPEWLVDPGYLRKVEILGNPFQGLQASVLLWSHTDTISKSFEVTL
jgi:hypothetical protein